MTFGLILIFNACGGEERSSSTQETTADSLAVTTPISSPTTGTNGDEPFALANTEEISETQYFRVLSPKTCTQKNQNRFIYQVMHDSYLWANNVPELDYTDARYNSSEEMLTALKSSKDKF